MCWLPDEPCRVLPPVVVVGGVVSDDRSDHGIRGGGISLVAPGQDVAAKSDLLLPYFGTPEHNVPKELAQEIRTIHISLIAIEYVN